MSIFTKNFKGFFTPSKIDLRKYDFNSYSKFFSLPHNKPIKRWQVLTKNVL